MKQKVLIAAPTSSVKNYCVNEYVSNVLAMGHDFLLADNTPDNANKELYNAMGLFNYIWIDPSNKNHFQVITESQNAIRKYFLENDYTHLMFIESDLLPPVWAVDKLLAHELLVVGFPYFIYNGSDTTLMIQKMLYSPSINWGFSTQLQKKEAFLFIDGSIKKLHALGFGCVLIAREIIESFPFRSSPDGYTIGETHADSFFYNDLERNGVPVFCDTSMVITHWNQDWLKYIEKPLKNNIS